MSEKKVKLVLELPQASYDRIVALQKKMEADDPAPVLLSALQLFEECVSLADKGHTFAKIDEAGNQTPFGIFG